MAAGTTRAVGYVRTAAPTATDKEHRTAAQARQIRRYCGAHGLVLVGSFVDYGVAGDAMGRTGLRDALSLLRDGQADVLVVANVSRLARSVALLARLVAAYFGDGGQALIAIDEGVDTRTPNGRFVLSLLDVIARWDMEDVRHAQ
jgi:DNA invertase Pin-like site-specific DNA recombinase